MKLHLPALVLGLGLSAALAPPAAAYPVDCAILLCLAGGWPASAECAHARAVFIARITPWPIEPPLQIWNCPMHVNGAWQRGLEQVFEIGAARSAPELNTPSIKPEVTVQTVGNQANVDLSDPAFDFVRSIRVFEITYRQSPKADGFCERSSTIVLGSYGSQGEYHRSGSRPAAVPGISGLKIPHSCRSYSYRSVFVEWRDYQGRYGSEEVRY